MTTSGERFLAEAEKSFNQRPKLKHMRIAVKAIAEWYENFDELFLKALPHGIVAHVEDDYVVLEKISKI